MPTFSECSNLRKLVISHKALLGDYNLFWALPSTPSDLLPPNIKTLVIMYANGDSAKWLQQIRRHEFANLKRVELVPQSEEVETAIMQSTSATQKLEEMGIELVLTQPAYAPTIAWVSD